jgi:hypothetical protein
MSNGNTQRESAATDGIGSAVARALSVLHEHGARAPASRSPQAWALDPTAAPGVRQLHQQLEYLRNQAQDLVDELVRVLESLAVSAATGTSPPLAPLASPGLAAGSLPGLTQLRRLVAMPGQTASTQFSLANDMRHPVEVLLKASSLIGPQGFELPSRYVGFAPNPLLVAASSMQPVDVTIRVPEQVPPGEYSGLVRGVGLEGASAQLTLEVKPAGETG